MERHPGQHFRTAFHAGVQTQRVEESKLGSVEKREKESKEMGRLKEAGRINRKLKKWKDLQEREAEPELRDRKWWKKDPGERKRGKFYRREKARVEIKWNYGKTRGARYQRNQRIGKRRKGKEKRGQWGSEALLKGEALKNRKRMRNWNCPLNDPNSGLILKLGFLEVKLGISNIGLHVCWYMKWAPKTTFPPPEFWILDHFRFLPGLWFYQLFRLKWQSCLIKGQLQRRICYTTKLIFTQTVGHTLWTQPTVLRFIWPTWHTWICKAQ